MAQERLTEWLEVTNQGISAYHADQFARPKESTKAFAAALARRGLMIPGTTVLDLACGAGAATGYLAALHPGVAFEGLDINGDLIAYGRRALAERPNVRLAVGDLYAPFAADSRPTYDGVISLQTLSWLPEPVEALRAIGRLGSRWFGCSSLFYDGPVTCTVQIRDYTKPAGGGATFVESYYNVYSLGLIDTLLRAEGFTRVDAEPFALDIDLPKPADGGMGTYTERLADGRRLSLSGPLLMPWYFLFAQR